MARRRRNRGETVSLFPFLSILACVIGTLTLMITALALGQIDNTQSPEVIARADEHEQRLAEIKTREEEADKLQRLLDEAAALREELTRALAELKRLQEQQKQDTKNADDSQKKKIQLLAEAAKLRQLIDGIQTELTSLLVKLRRLQAELRTRKNPPKEAVVKIQPGGSGLDLDPTFVECIVAGVVLLTFSLYLAQWAPVRATPPIAAPAEAEAGLPEPPPVPPATADEILMSLAEVGNAI